AGHGGRAGRWRSRHAVREYQPVPPRHKRLPRVTGRSSAGAGRPGPGVMAGRDGPSTAGAGPRLGGRFQSTEDTMGLMDRVREQAAQLAQKTQEAAQEGRVMLDQAQARRRADAMFRDLGAAVYAERTGRGGADGAAKIDRLVKALSRQEAEQGLGDSGSTPSGQDSSDPPPSGEKSSDPPPSGQKGSDPPPSGEKSADPPTTSMP